MRGAAIASWLRTVWVLGLLAVGLVACDRQECPNRAADLVVSEGSAPGIYSIAFTLFGEGTQNLKVEFTANGGTPQPATALLAGDSSIAVSADQGSVSEAPSSCQGSAYALTWDTTKVPALRGARASVVVSVIPAAGAAAVSERFEIDNRPDPCLTNNGGCPESSTCTREPADLETGRTCTCKRGFESRDGNRTCVDVNECSEPSSCDRRISECSNTIGGYVCNCNEGYRHPNAEEAKTCEDIDECAASPCAVTAVCRNLAPHQAGGRRFECTCTEYGQPTADGLGCDDVDECAQPTFGGCDRAHGTCENRIRERAVCGCWPGFALGADGQTCAPIDECAQPNVCPPGETCVDTVPAQSGALGYRCHLCGNGRLEGEDGETCDPGPAGSAGCTSACVIVMGYACTGSPSVCSPVCGDQFVVTGRECEGNDFGGLTCATVTGGQLPEGRLACAAGCAIDASGCSKCGDGHRQAAEQCDDRNSGAGDGCSGSCQIEDGWACTAAEPSLCSPIFGDGKRRGTESCDDGNASGGDGCSASSTVEIGWRCDNGEPSTCVPICGDGIRRGAETCDDGNTGGDDGCGAACRVEPGWICSTATPNVCTPICRDGLRRGTEQCDDHDADAGDGCSPACQVEDGWICDNADPSNCSTVCNDRKTRGAEGCDDGSGTGGDGCSAACQVEPGWTCTRADPSVCTPICGDGLKLPQEQCDDGNQVLDPCPYGQRTACTVCGPSCTFAASPLLSYCGDRQIDSAHGESCDDGNNADGDGCSSACRVVCGDGVRYGAEACDDGNTRPHDGCDDACRVEPGWTCSAGSPDLCTLLGYLRIRRTDPTGFLMGSPSGELLRESSETRHYAIITRDFWMKRTEVTQDEWYRVMGDEPSARSGCRDCPVERVSWNDAVEFVNRLSVRDALTPCYTGSALSWTFVGLDCEGYRLPTEAEWEYAGRAGATSAFYSGPVTIDVCDYEPALEPDAWYCGGGFPGGIARTQGVAQLGPNDWLLYDMEGNVSEWVHDWYGTYPLSGTADHLGPQVGSARVIRGGNFQSPPTGDGSRRPGPGCRLAGRSFGHPDVTKTPNIGFRVARTAL